MKRCMWGILLNILPMCLLTYAQASFSIGVFDALNAPEPALPNERVVSVPGDANWPVMLQVTIATPDGPGPFPLAIMNHGAKWDASPSEQPRNHLTFAADYFLSRGYAVALPMMRGYAGSGGKLIKRGCDLVALGTDAARDIRAVIEYMKQQPYVDGSRVVVAGESFGGWNTLALGALNMPNVKGLVSFAGGAKVRDCDSPDDSLIDAAGELGAHTSIPSIWFFGDNDAVFKTATWHAMHEHYVAAGGHAELVAYGPFMTDSHSMLGSWEGLPIWVPRLDAFLAGIGLPGTLTYPDDMPVPVPPPSHYAKIDDVDAVPYLQGEQEKALYRRFLERPLPRAFAVGERGAAAGYEGFDPLTKAMRSCEKMTSGCRIYAVDNDVVWKRPTAAHTPTNFAALTDESAVPYVNAAGRGGYRKFLAASRPRAFVIAPDGTWFLASLGADPVAFAMNACQKSHHDCRLYAVDGDVVWSK